MKIVFFDGYCSLCNALVDWIIRLDKNGQLKFASLQGETAAKLLARPEKSIDVDTIIYLRDNQRFERSTAVINILSDLGGPWGLMRIFLLVPKYVRDIAYRLVAKNRFRLMKKRETCRMPTASEKDRLLR